MLQVAKSTIKCKGVTGGWSEYRENVRDILRGVLNKKVCEYFKIFEKLAKSKSNQMVNL